MSFLLSSHWSSSSVSHWLQHKTLRIHSSAWGHLVSHPISAQSLFSVYSIKPTNSLVASSLVLFHRTICTTFILFLLMFFKCPPSDMILNLRRLSASCISSLFLRDGGRGALLRCLSQPAIKVRFHQGEFYH